MSSIEDRTVAQQFSEWIPTRGPLAGHPRYYINLERDGVLEIERHGSGHVRWARICGERLANGRAEGWGGMKIWLDDAGSLHADEDGLERLQTSVEGIVACLAGMDAEEEDIGEEDAREALRRLAQRMDAVAEEKCATVLSAILHEVHDGTPDTAAPASTPMYASAEDLQSLYR